MNIPHVKNIDIPLHEYLFSYGTLQQESVQLELFGRVLVAHPDVLFGFKTLPIQIKDKSFQADDGEYLIAIPSPGSNDKITGMLLEVTKDELLITDEYEPEEYIRKAVTLQSGTRAWVYSAR